MAPGAESVPFAFVAEAERYQSNVTPPERAPLSVKRVLAGFLITALLAAGLATAVLLGTPALTAPAS
ncbi:hypothetical protein CFP65_0212 [Kitasatospora sp. MMS16-BH015]|uniref:hypothetical protein n=1 Tax=Kitasatospora sp. MMS16-BH015 TaxID=2018025 RepID=UPI000CA36CE5|nr:hypothetical protein [Kitasatospora sp. MMS16-BH015]AUG75193.1 hypothetical protein CFP65_0212 [Kitasatospora sp. MMS16-BH015]